MRHGLGHLRVVVREGGATAGDGAPGQALLGRELKADDVLGKAVNRRAAENAALGVDEIAVDGLRAQELGDLVHEPLQHRVQLELAGHYLRCLQERALLAEPAFVLLQELSSVDGEPDLVRDRLDQRDVAGRPLARRRPVEAEHTDHPVEDEDRRRKRRLRVQALECLSAAEGRIIELRGGRGVGHADRPALA